MKKEKLTRQFQVNIIVYKLQIISFDNSHEKLTQSNMYRLAFPIRSFKVLNIY